MLPSRERALWIAREILPHEPALRAWLRHRRVAGLEVDDIIQETYAVLADLAAVDHILSPRAYAFQTARSLIVRHCRRAKIVRMDALDDGDFDAIALDAPSPEQHASAREELRHVADLIGRLPARCREALMLRRVEGLSQREVARRMGISEHTVEKHIGRALRDLVRAFRSGGGARIDGAEDHDPA